MASDLKAQLELTADASGVEAGVGKAKKSLASLGVSAESTAKKGSAFFDKIGTASARTSRSIDVTVAKMQLQAATVGKTATQTALYELSQKGASRAQLAAAASALKTVDAYKAQELALTKAKDSAAKYGAYLATMAVGAVVALGVSLRRSLNAVDGFNDLRDATGASIENISALDRIARETGGTFDQVSGTLIKFNTALKDAQPGKGVGAVFKALNLEVAELKKLDPAEALRRTAMALQGFADDGAKARAVQELFGKSVKETAPFLKDLAEAGKLQATVSTQAAEEIDRFNKELAKLKANSDDAQRAMSIGLITEINRVIDRFREGQRAGKSFLDTVFPSDAEMKRRFAEAKGGGGRFQPTFSPDDQSAAEMARLRRQNALPSLTVPTDPKKPRGAGSDPLAEASSSMS